jgi:hypothetical protein
MNAGDYSHLDEGLEILSAYGPEYGGGLTNHAPMAIEALSALGRSGSVIPWLERYRKGLQPRLAARGRIEDWQTELGDYARVAEWMAFFENESKERAWQELLALWLPRLAPGLIAAATHGPIRVGHAARGLENGETPRRVRELTEGLGYWAATYHVLPGLPASAGTLRPSQAIARLELMPDEQRGRFRLISEAVGQLGSFAPFADAAGLVDTSGEASEFLSDLTATFARAYLANARSTIGTIVFVHSVTGPSSLRPMLPYLTAEQTALALRCAWQAAAALFTVYGIKPAPDGVIEAEGIDREDLVDGAIECGDEHAIKFTEVCLREHGLNPRTEYLAAARHAIGALRR